MKAWAIGAALLLAGSQDAAREEAANKLKNLKVTLDFRDAPLDAVVDYLREISGLNLFVDEKAREKGIVVTLKVSDLSLGGIFALMLKPHGCDVHFMDGVLQIMTVEEIGDRTVKMELYDCRDLLHPITDMPGVDITLGEIGTLVSPIGPETASEPFPIEEMVRAHTGGRSWDENPKTAVSMQNGILVVKNTPEVHGQVRRLLDLLRANK